jgi:glycosyltransferase involved in cell wall biosynthesis
MDQAPLISVVTPARDAAATLAQTLDSLLAQSLGDWECIIVNDGSTDATAAIIDAYRARDSRFRTVLGAGQGVCAARNLGIAVARGKWLHFLDADDWNDPAFYQKLVQAAAAMPDAVAVYSEFLRAMPGGVMAEISRLPADPENPFEDFARGCLVAMGAVLVNRDLVLRLGGFDSSLRVCEDWDLWQRVARFGGSWAVVKEKLAFYRTEGPSLSARVDWMNEDGRKVIALPVCRWRMPAGLRRSLAVGSRRWPIIRSGPWAWIAGPVGRGAWIQEC